MAVLKTDASRKAGNSQTGGWISAREMPAPGKGGGGHMETGPTLTEKANHFHSQIHRSSPQVQNSN